jgi:ATP-binding cassette subfamily B protein
MQIFISIFKSIFIIKTGQKIDAQLILGYYKHLLTLPQRFFDTMRTGEIISRIIDAVKIRVFINDVIITFFVNVFIIIFSFVLMFTYYWKLAVIILMIIPFHLIIYLITNRLNKKTERKLMENAADLESQLVESLNNVRTIKQFGIEKYSNLKIENRFVKLLNNTYTSGLNFLFSSNSTEFINRLFVIILLWIGSSFVIDKFITPGELLSFYAIIGYFTSPISSLVQMNKTIQNASIAADRLFEIMDLEKENSEHKVLLAQEQIGDIVFKDVDFSYGTRVQVFDKLSLKIEKGNFTAIVGESGSGKTTLMAVLQRLYPISSGHISIGEFDINHIDSDSLKNIITVVPQEIHLFSGTIIENIALGEIYPDMNKILNICSALGITEFIKEMLGGFETHLGEHGVNLSGGQRQRISIARALYKNPEIIILDEAASSLDSISEYYVQQTINDLKALGKTIIVISHRLSTNIKADKILVLESGKLIEQGNHEELLAAKGKYYQPLLSETFKIKSLEIS